MKATLIALPRTCATIATGSMHGTDDGSASCDVLVRCTGVSARWCPICGDCTCPYDEKHGWGPGVFDKPTDDECPLHGVASQHAEGEHEQ